MKLKQLTSILLSAVMLTATSVNTAFADSISTSDAVTVYANDEADTVYVQATAREATEIDGKNVIDYAQYANKEITVDLNLTNVENTAGINNYTLFVEYNPDVVQMTGVYKPASTDGYMTYTNSTGTESMMYTESSITGSINLIPDSTNFEYSDLITTDTNTLTCAELGRVKMANYFTNDDGWVTITDSGIFVSLTFKVVGEGDANITLNTDSVYVDNFCTLPKSDATINTVVLPDNISVQNLSGTEVTTETTTTTTIATEATTEITTVAENTIYVQPSAREAIEVDGKNVVDYATYKDKEIIVDINLSNLENTVGLNSYTFYVEYNPQVVQMTGAYVPSSTKGYITYDSEVETNCLLYKKDVIAQSVALVPSATSPDYIDLMTGDTNTLSCAELGRVKMANYFMNDKGWATITDSGIFASLTFKVIGEGDANITLNTVSDMVDGFVSIPTSGIIFSTVILPDNIVVGTVPEGITKGTTTEATTETTTEATTETTTHIDGTVYVQAVARDAVEVNGKNIVDYDTYKDKEITVDLMLSNLENTAGINNYTIFVEYNPDVVQMTGVSKPASLDNYATYTDSLLGEQVMYNADAIATSIALLPDATSPDYNDLITGDTNTLTAAQLGRVKMANVFVADGKLVGVTKSGIMVSLTFKVVGEGDASITVNTDSPRVDNFVTVAPAINTMQTIVLPDNIVVGTVPETTTEPPTETTTVEIPSNAEACGDNTYYTYDNGEISIGGNGNMSDFTVSDTPWSQQKDEIKSITVGDDVSKIGDDAFTSCSALSEVLLSTGVQEIGSGAFRGCTSIKEIIIPDTVTSIGALAFDGIADGAVIYNYSDTEIDSLQLGENTNITVVKAYFEYGEIGVDRKLTSTDASALLQKALDNDFKMNIERYTKSYMRYSDVSGDNKLSAVDAAQILQKALDNDYSFPVEKAN